jgi:fluoroquinolone transport system ATP-binding protein
MISVSNLVFTYPGGVAPAVRDMSFEVADGEVFGFLGPSGAGKSTTQNILIGLLRGWEGTIEVEGRSLNSWGSDYYRRIGVSFELPNHYLKLTARENLEYFRALYDGNALTVEEVLERVDLAEHADKPAGAFSKGMKNRLNLARSMLHRPKLWFLDEPTAGLDPVNAMRVRQLILDRKAEGVTTFLTTHSMGTADAVCDRVAFIVDGQIAAIDTPAALRQAYGTREVEVAWEGGDARFPLDGLADNAAFLEALRTHDVTTVHSQETTLEDVFAQVTGRALS